MRHRAFLCCCLPAEPNECRADKERNANDQESVVKSHDVGVAPDCILDLALRLLGRGYDIITFIYKCSGKRLHPLMHDGTVCIDICANLEIVELLTTSDDRVKHSRADAPAKVPRNVEDGRAVPGIFGQQQGCG